MVDENAETKTVVTETVTTTGPVTNRSIYDVLKDDHKKVSELFKQILEKRQPSAATFAQIKMELDAHMAGEEKHFYPAIKQGSDMAFLVDEASVEHNTAKTLIGEVGALSETDEMWLPKVKVLCDIISHHVEEEEKELFKGAKKVLTKEDEKRIAQLFLDEKVRMMRTKQTG